MAEHHQESAAGGADFDLTQFYQIFFEEAGENLDQMEQMLVDLDLTQADDEALNGIFRCAHSIKGGAATFGFRDVTELTHHMESLLDRLRRHEIKPVPQMVDVLLESADASRSLLARHQAGGQGEAISTHELVRSISALASGAQPVVAASAPVPEIVPVPAPTSAAQGLRALEILIGPLEHLAQADAIKELFRDIPGLGQIDDLPAADAGMRRFAVQTSSSNDDLLDLMTFHVAKEKVAIVALDAAAAAAPAVAQVQDAAQPYGFFSGAPGVPADELAAAALAVAAPAVSRAAPARAAAESKGASQASMESSTIRVAVNKVDQLINLVGELVITQAMLAQNSRGLDAGVHQQLLAGLADLDRNTRDLQESVLSIRMIPMSVVFNRFPRMLRDLAGKLGKKVDFVTHGEATELDKSLVEKITDPLTHLVRNSCDHGIETPAERIAAGKTEAGRLFLSASHQGGNIIIEVSDDGAGLNRERILAKAQQQGMDVSDTMTDAEVWQLIFAPGFSTAEAVTDVSGRGVGMDVVKRNISAMGGVVDIRSAKGFGTTISISLPLTLAILDGMSIRVGDEVYILPLGFVIESLQPAVEDIKDIAGRGQVVKVRGEYLPLIPLYQMFDIAPRFVNPSEGICVILETEGRKAALFVDDLVGQQQVVVKNLESNYRKVVGISGATILGDGGVSLILDVAALIRSSRQLADESHIFS